MTFLEESHDLISFELVFNFNDPNKYWILALILSSHYIFPLQTRLEMKEFYFNFCKNQIYDLIN